MALEIKPRQPSAKGPDDRFTGDVWIDPIARGVDGSRLQVSVVHFTPGARSAWHAHALGQTLYVTEGVGLIRAAVRTSTRFGAATSCTRRLPKNTGMVPHPTGL